MGEMNFAGRRVLVTGHTGFKGAWLTFILAELGAEVVGLSRERPESESHAYWTLGVGGRIVNSESDLGDVSLLPAFSRFFDSAGPFDDVFHLAGQAIVSRAFEAPAETYHTNILGHLNILESMRNQSLPPVGVLVTSDKVYLNDNSGRIFSEADELGGTEPYSGSKASAEILVASYLAAYPAVAESGIGIARAGNVFGWGDTSPNRLVPDIIAGITQSGRVELRNPSSTRPWTNVIDILRGYLLLSQHLRQGKVRTGEAWNFASGEKFTVEQVASILMRSTRYRPQVSRGPAEAFPEAELLQISPEKANQVLGWTPAHSIEFWLEELSDWVNDRLNVRRVLDRATEMVRREFC